jgi:phosphate transport system substrate-binding protein
MTGRWVACALAACLALAAVGMVGCSSLVTSDAAVAKDQTRLRASGSGTCLPLVRILAASWPDQAARLVFLPGLRTKGGVKGVSQGSLDVGAISRKLTRDEQSTDLRVTWLSSDGLAMAVNPSVARLGIKALTGEQVRSIYSGNVRDWKQLGATESLPIVVLDRHEDESAKIILREFVLGPADTFKVTAESVNLYYESDMVDALQTTSGAIGYFSLGLAVSQQVPVTLLSLDGVEPTVANIESGKYRIVRPLGVVTRADASEPVQAFIEWITSDEARRIRVAKGYAPYHE